jgi:hypothetical protein
MQYNTIQYNTIPNAEVMNVESLNRSTNHSVYCNTGTATFFFLLIFSLCQV